RDGAARPLGDLAAGNMLGAVGGALAAGFVVLPAIGLRAGFLLAAVAYVVLADLVAPAGARLRPLGYAALLALVALDPVRAPLTHLASGETLRALAEGPAGIVTVVDTGDDLQPRRSSGARTYSSWSVTGAAGSPRAPTGTTSSSPISSSPGTRARAASTRARCSRPSRAGSRPVASSASGCRSTS